MTGKLNQVAQETFSEWQSKGNSQANRSALCKKCSYKPKKSLVSEGQLWRIEYVLINKW